MTVTESLHAGNMTIAQVVDEFALNLRRYDELEEACQNDMRRINEDALCQEIRSSHIAPESLRRDAEQYPSGRDNFLLDVIDLESALESPLHELANIAAATMAAERKESILNEIEHDMNALADSCAVQFRGAIVDVKTVRQRQFGKFRQVYGSDLLEGWGYSKKVAVQGVLGRLCFTTDGCFAEVKRKGLTFQAFPLVEAQTYEQPFQLTETVPDITVVNTFASRLVRGIQKAARV